MPSRRKLAPVVNKDGISGVRGVAANREQEVPVVEIDTTFGRLLGLSDSQKIGILLHLDPPLAHTVNIEPLTPADWEIIELHATFLELNLLSQIRALPNPSYEGPPSSQAEVLHPLTLHLSPTSTANIVVTSLSPAPPSSSPFAKIAPDAEVIVAPKVRPRSSRSTRGETRSIASTSRKSTGTRSGGSTVRPKSQRGDPSGRGALYLRGVDREICGEWFDEEEDDRSENSGLKVWVDRDILLNNALRGVSWVSVSVVKPAGIQAPIDPQAQKQQREQESAEAGKPASKVVAKLLSWPDAPDTQHVGMSSELCSALGQKDLVGDVVRIEAAPAQIQKSALKALRIYPFSLDSSQRKDGLRFGGDSQSSREAAADRLRAHFGAPGDEKNLLSGPLTDGMILPPFDDQIPGARWDGGIVRFDPPTSAPSEAGKSLSWLLGSEKTLNLEIQPEIIRPPQLNATSSPEGDSIPREPPDLVGIDPMIAQCLDHLTHSSSILLTGGLGSGKTSLCYLLSHHLRKQFLFNVTYFSCRTLVTDETRVSTIKEKLNRLFMYASWCARLGGHSVVILDDLDKLCPVETELQVGGDNGRSRHVSEIISSSVREYCTMSSGVVLLATAQSKESLNNIIVGGHVVREIVTLKAPDKDGRRKVLQKLTFQGTKSLQNGTHGHKRIDSHASGDSWMDPSNPTSRPGSSGTGDGFVLDTSLDFLDLAGQTDGYMPGDLVLLVARARNEALIRTVQVSPSSDTSTINLTKEDFSSALKGFTPASLRNVTLTSSTTTFDSIGGLTATRKILLETLQYPTKYAPIFAQCPLRLRSGLLLYGYPGCGKTLLASAVAGECGLNFISVKGPEILNKYIGASEKSVRDLFERAEAARPCILFFDEFDSIAPKRGHDSTGVTDRVVNQLLTQMDGAEGLSGVYVLAATSRPDLIDPALLRPGRLDKSLLCDMPDLADRFDILRALGKKLNISPEATDRLDQIAQQTEGYSGADLQAVAYNAHLEAIHDVLGDRDAKPGSKDSTSQTKSGSTSHKEFIQFPFSEKEEHGVSSESSHKALADRAVIAAKLSALKSAARRQRQLERGEMASGNSDLNEQNGDKSEEVVIEWKHLERSLQDTRSSISREERRRLEAIYREFVGGFRTGEMPSGQGGSEIGGRTSLM
jgi:peroxin-1